MNLEREIDEINEKEGRSLFDRLLGWDKSPEIIELEKKIEQQKALKSYYESVLNDETEIEKDKAFKSYLESFIK